MIEITNNQVENDVEQPFAPQISDETEETAEEEKVSEKTVQAESPAIAPFMSFEDAIKEGLEMLKLTDETLAANMRKKNKSVKECCNYILDYVSKHRKGSKAMGVKDSDVFNLCKIYFADDTIKATKAPTGVSAVASTPTPSAQLQQTLDKAADKAKKLSKAEQKQAEHERKMKIAETIVLPNAKKAMENQPKVFSGLKKGTKEYNQALNDQLQGSLFDFD